MADQLPPVFDPLQPIDPKSPRMLPLHAMTDQPFINYMVVYNTTRTIQLINALMIELFGKLPQIGQLLTPDGRNPAPCQPCQPLTPDQPPPSDAEPEP